MKSQKSIAVQVGCSFLLAACSTYAQQDLLNMKGVDRPSPLKNVGIDQKLDSKLPLALEFKDETGKTVKLGDFFG